MKIKFAIIFLFACIAAPSFSQDQLAHVTNVVKSIHTTNCPTVLTLKAGESAKLYPDGSCDVVYMNPQQSQPPQQELRTHFLFGPDGGYNFGNTFIGFKTKIEMPLGKHLEIDSSATLDPYESHIALGHGFTYSVMPGAIFWVNRTSGFEGLYSHGAYTVTKAAKAADYVYAGYVYKHTMIDLPTRFHFDYFRQVHNGISANGTETNHVTGGSFTWDNLVGCFQSGCAHSEFTWYTGRTLNQGNPVCDGQYTKVITCPRQSVLSGGFEYSVLFEFPRRADSDDLF